MPRSFFALLATLGALTAAAAMSASPAVAATEVPGAWLAQSEDAAVFLASAPVDGLPGAGRASAVVAIPGPEPPAGVPRSTVRRVALAYTLTRTGSGITLRMDGNRYEGSERPGALALAVRRPDGSPAEVTFVPATRDEFDAAARRLEERPPREAPAPLDAVAQLAATVFDNVSTLDSMLGSLAVSLEDLRLQTGPEVRPLHRARLRELTRAPAADLALLRAWPPLPADGMTCAAAARVRGRADDVATWARYDVDDQIAFHAFRFETTRPPLDEATLAAEGLELALANVDPEAPAVRELGEAARARARRELPLVRQALTELAELDRWLRRLKARGLARAAAWTRLADRRCPTAPPSLPQPHAPSGP